MIANSIFRFNLIQWSILILFAISAIFFLIRAVKELQPNEPVKDNKDKLHRSFRVGLCGGGFWASCQLSLFAYFWANMGIKGAIYVLVIIGGCTLPLMVLICTIGSYIQQTWAQGFRGIIKHIGSTRHP